MTPFGHKLRQMREARPCQLKDLAKALKVSSAYLSALEHGHRGKPSPGLVQQVAGPHRGGSGRRGATDPTADVLHWCIALHTALVKDGRYKMFSFVVDE